MKIDASSFFGQGNKPISGKAKYGGLGKKAFLVIDEQSNISIKELNALQRIKRFFQRVINELRGQMGNPVARKLSGSDIAELNNQVQQLKKTKDQQEGWDIFIQRVKDMCDKENRLVQKLLNGNKKVNWEATDEKSRLKQEEAFNFLMDHTDVNTAYQKFLGKPDAKEKTALSFESEKWKEYLKQLNGKKSPVSDEHKPDVKPAESSPKKDETSVRRNIKETIMKSPEVHAAFSKHLKDEYSKENLDFLDALVDYRKKFDEVSKKNGNAEKAMKPEATKIYNKFILKTVDSTNINIPDDVNNRVTLKFKEAFEQHKGDIEKLFDEAETEIWNLLLNDSWPRFTKTREYKALNL